MADLSPAAQAVMDAMRGSLGCEPTLFRHLAAAALAALADQVVPPESLRLDNCCDHRSMGHRHQILAIAAELRGETTTTEPQP